MSGILRRTVFFHAGDKLHDERIRFVDWAQVETGLGVCWEPWEGTRWVPGDGLANYDPAEDDISRVDRLEGVDRHRMFAIHCEGDDNMAIHSGYMYPRAIPI